MKRINQVLLFLAFSTLGLLFINMQTPSSMNGYYNALENGIPYSKAELSHHDQSSVMTLYNKVGTTIGEITFIGYRLGDQTLLEGIININDNGISIESSNAKAYDIVVPNFSNDYGQTAAKPNPYRTVLNEGVGIAIKLVYAEDILNGKNDKKWQSMDNTLVGAPCPETKKLNAYNHGGAGADKLSYYKELQDYLHAIFVICSEGNYAVATLDSGNCVQSDCWE